MCSRKSSSYAKRYQCINEIVISRPRQSSHKVQTRAGILLRDALTRDMQEGVELEAAGILCASGVTGCFPSDSKRRSPFALGKNLRLLDTTAGGFRQYLAKGTDAARKDSSFRSPHETRLCVAGIFVVHGLGLHIIISCWHLAAFIRATGSRTDEDM